MSSGASDLSAQLAAGTAHHRAGRLAEAEAIYREVLAHYPGFPDVLYNLGLLLHAQARHDEAEEVLGSALELRPLYVEAITALGNVVQARGRGAEAVALFRKALELRPDAAEIHNNLGNALKLCGRIDEALPHLEQATRLNPRFADAFYNLGNALNEAGRLGDAVERYRRALALNPLSAPTLNNLGSVLKEQGRLAEAADCYRRAIAMAPDFADPQHNLLFLMHYRDDVAPEEIAEAHRDWAFRQADRIAPLPPDFAHVRDPDRRLRVGYVSPDFHVHPVATFFEPLLGAHDRGAVEIFCYSAGKRSDATTARLQQAADHWRDIQGESDTAAASRVRADAIDILVDLAGHTGGNRLGLFARRAAPVQITWLGYPASTGMAAMHHRVSDAIADPPGAQAHHSERLLRLAGGFLCYLPPADAPAILPSPAPAPGAVTFGSFNNFSKLSPATLRLWAAILHALPSARLVLKAKQSSDPETVARLAGAFATAGIDSARIEFRRTQRTPAEHLASYRDIDIALDPFPYNGTTTSCEAMWMGVPVIALAGSAHAGRVGASLLTRVGLADLLAANEESYLRIATALAHDLPRLAALRDGLRERMRPGLGDAARFAREMEEAYRAAWAEWLSAR